MTAASERLSAPALDLEQPKKLRRTPSFDPEIVAPRDLKAIVGLSPCTVWRLRRADQFPAPIRLSVGRIGWRRVDLDAWLSERAAGSTTK